MKYGIVLHIYNVLQLCNKLWIPHALKESFIWSADTVTCQNYPSELQSLLEPYKFLHENHFFHFSPKLWFGCKQFSLFLKIVIIMRMMVPNIFRKLRVGLTGLDIKLRKLIQSIPIYHFSVYNTWIKVRYDLVRQLLSSFAGLVDSVVTALLVS